MYTLNLKLKDNVDENILLEYGFKPKYDVDTGEIIEYRNQIDIDNSNHYFTFVLTSVTEKHWFKIFRYDAWMTGFEWGHITNRECLELLFKLIKDDIVEIAYKGSDTE